MSNLDYRNAVDSFVESENDRLKAQIEEKAENGSIYVEIWQRDCDQVEATSLAIIPAKLSEFTNLEESVYESAEGAVSLAILTPSQYRSWTRTIRDRRAEQYNY